MTDQEQKRHERVLIVAADEALRDSLVDTLENAGGFVTAQAGSFEEALSELLLNDFTLIVTETELPDLSGMDLLAVVGGLRPDASIMMIDDDLSAKSAVAAFRLGAVDYLYKPVNLEFILMQIEREMEIKRARAVPLPPEQPRHVSARDRERRLNPDTRAAALVLNRGQFQQIMVELNRLRAHIRADFVGLVDSDGNMVGAAGTLEEFDLPMLTRALAIDHDSTRSLAAILSENRFHSTYFEGEHSGVYIIEFGHPYPVSLAVICPADVKPGMVWLYIKRTAHEIDGVLQTVRVPRATPNLAPTSTPDTEE
jgi:DNA-binding response OmpR family regulator